MITNLSILYISLAGNTRSFVSDLQDYAQQQHTTNPALPTISLTEISDATPLRMKQNPLRFCAHILRWRQWYR